MAQRRILGALMPSHFPPTGVAHAKSFRARPPGVRKYRLVSLGAEVLVLVFVDGALAAVAGKRVLSLNSHQVASGTGLRGAFDGTLERCWLGV